MELRRIGQFAVDSGRVLIVDAPYVHTQVEGQPRRVKSPSRPTGQGKEGLSANLDLEVIDHRTAVR
jgi:hypothetical protein